MWYNACGVISKEFFAVLYYKKNEMAFIFFILYNDQPMRN